MTSSDQRAKAEAAKAWRPYHHCDAPRAVGTVPADVQIVDCGTCHACLGAQRAAEDIAEWITDAYSCARLYQRSNAISSANKASRIASYFASEPNPVSIFRDAVKEACK